MIEVYGAWSSNPMKVRLGLEELGLPYRWHDLDLGKRDQRTPEHLARHPRGKVPVLMADGVRVFESNAALVWLGERTGRLWPTDSAGRGEALSWMFTEAAAFQDAAGTFFWHRAVAPRFGRPPLPDADIEAATKKLRPLLDVLTERLGNGPYLLGDFSLVDCAYGAWFPVLPLADHPALAAWLQRLRERPSWSTCAVERTYGLG